MTAASWTTASTAGTSTAPQCPNKCRSFLGLVFEDGLPPHFLRYAINSAALTFKPAQLFEDPKGLLEAKRRVRVGRRLKHKRDVLEREPLADGL